MESSGKGDRGAIIMDRRQFLTGFAGGACLAVTGLGLARDGETKREELDDAKRRGTGEYNMQLAKAKSAIAGFCAFVAGGAAVALSGSETATSPLFEKRTK